MAVTKRRCLDVTRFVMGANRMHVLWGSRAIEQAAAPADGTQNVETVTAGHGPSGWEVI